MQLESQFTWPVVVAGCLLATSAIVANMISLVMIGRINAQSAESERISNLWWGAEVRRRFKQLFPGDRLVYLLDACVATMVASFIALVRFWVFS